MLVSIPQITLAKDVRRTSIFIKANIITISAGSRAKRFKLNDEVIATAKLLETFDMVLFIENRKKTKAVIVNGTTDVFKHIRTLIMHFCLGN